MQPEGDAVTYEIEIERGKIAEFARATYTINDRYQDVDAVIPPTFLTIANNLWRSDDAGLAGLQIDMARVLHAEEEFCFHGRVPRAGQTLQVSTRLGNERVKEGKRGGQLRFVTIVNEFRDDSGDLVAEQVTTLVETSRVPQAQT